MKQTNNISYQRRAVSAAVVVVGLSLAYFTGTWAIDNGSLWIYALTFLLVILSAKFLVRVFGRDHESR